jgi:hypothetical protein
MHDRRPLEIICLFRPCTFEDYGVWDLGNSKYASAHSFRVLFPICGCIFAFICSIEDRALGSFCMVIRSAVFRLAGHTKASVNDTGVEVTI